MQDLFGQLGINLPMLLAQILNFAILLVVLTLFVYRPLIKLMAERQQKIKFGLEGAKEVENKLAEIETLKEHSLAQANKTALKIVGEAENLAVKTGQEIVTQAEKRGENILLEAQHLAEIRRAEELDKLSTESRDLVRLALAQAVGMNPDEVDEKLITEASRLVDNLKTKI